MYGSGSGINMYKKTQVNTADPIGLIVMCYEEAIKNMRIARENLLSREYEAKGKAIQKVQDILSVLMQSLDFERGGLIARNLNSLYTYMANRITEGDLQKDVEIFDEVMAMLEELGSGWKEISNAPRGEHLTGSLSARDMEAGAKIAGAY